MMVDQSPAPKAHKHALSTTNCPAAKRYKGEARYDDIDSLLENESSPIYKAGTPIKVCWLQQASSELH